MKRTLLTIALAALTIGLLGSCKKEDPKVSVAGVTLEPTSLEITVGDDVKLTATVAPENATDKTVSWSSDKDKVASVDKEGNVHAVAPGAANITVTTTDGSKTAACVVTVKAALPTGALSGKFTVNAEGKQVYFSKGNLWADGSNVLHFEDAQWKSSPASDGSKDASHVSHFTWSSTVEKAVGTGNDGDFLFCDESHKQSVDGSEAIYYALSTAEWQYLINKNNDENIRKGKYKDGVTVCEKANCLILVPDECLNGYSFDNTKTSYSIEEWATAEAAGLVCLPAAGRRLGSSVLSVGDNGFYWSSSASDSGNAYSVYFNSSNVYPDSSGNFNRYDGYSVRLITESK